ncbi:hypothetical protein POM88_023789 [Heracleum sosnowskyi]|uniref:Pentatricopeptide repeat-containing protein n=1 Tax=Heracleum sosnowskyi TaxID=360622 RepID=A0AAD8IJD5_9APIA|nr:hypothetical protein POM88_023789 [Heracleum sosnowskyi]
MGFMCVSSQLVSILPGSVYSCSSLSSQSSSTSVVHIRAHSNYNSKTNRISRSTRPRTNFRQLLLQKSKSGFDNLDDALVVIAINCSCHSNRLDDAISLLATIFKRGFVPTGVTYTTLIRELLSQHKSAEARLLFTNLIKFRELQPDTATYNTVIDSSCKRGLVDDAFNLHSEMMEKGILPDVRTYTMIIQVLCKFSRWEEVGLLLNQMMEDMNISPNVHTFTILVNTYSKSGKLDDAKWMIEIMTEWGEYPNVVTYNSLMSGGLCKNHYVDKALSLFRTIECNALIPESNTYNIIIRGCLRSKKYDGLLTSLVKVKQYAVVVSLVTDLCALSIPFSIITFNIAINCCCHSNWVDYEFSLLASTFKRGFVADVATYTTLIRGLVSQHKSAEARLFFTNLIKFRQVQPNVVTFNTMINGLCKTLVKVEEAMPAMLKVTLADIESDVNAGDNALERGQKRITLVKVEEAMPAMLKVTLADIESDVNAGDNALERVLDDAGEQGQVENQERVDGDAKLPMVT